MSSLRSAFVENVAWGASGETWGVAGPPSCPCRPGHPTGCLCTPSTRGLGEGGKHSLLLKENIKRQVLLLKNN